MRPASRACRPCTRAASATTRSGRWRRGAFVANASAASASASSRLGWLSSATLKARPSASSRVARCSAAPATSSTRTLESRCRPSPGIAPNEVGRENALPAPSVQPGPYTVQGRSTTARQPLADAPPDDVLAVALAAPVVVLRLARGVLDEGHAAVRPVHAGRTHVHERADAGLERERGDPLGALHVHAVAAWCRASRSCRSRRGGTRA